MLYKFSIQAISKWENNQGFPETEKLLLLSNMFEVSTDFLLKNKKTYKPTKNADIMLAKKWQIALLLLNLAIGVLGFMYSPGVMETYELPVRNDEYSKRFFFKY